MLFGEFTVERLQYMVMILPGLLMGFTFHEFGHAWVANRFGDDTARLLGRVTLSPLAHLDPLGTILLLLGGFGWAKPVPVNVNRLRPRVWGDIAVSLAGVAMNFLLALMFYALYLIAENPDLMGSLYNPILADTLFYSGHINVFLIAFNLLPIPPLDGFRVARYLFPSGMEGVVDTLYRMGPILLILLFVTDFADPILTPVYRSVWSAITSIVHLVL